jgi:hypothetical protein
VPHLRRDRLTVLRSATGQALDPPGQVGLQPGESLFAQVGPLLVAEGGGVLALAGGGPRSGAGGVVAILLAQVVSQFRSLGEGAGIEAGRRGVDLLEPTVLAQGQPLGRIG